MKIQDVKKMFMKKFIRQSQHQLAQLQFTLRPMLARSVLTWSMFAILLHTISLQAIDPLAGDLGELSEQTAETAETTNLTEEATDTIHYLTPEQSAARTAHAPHAPKLSTHHVATEVAHHVTKEVAQHVTKEVAEHTAKRASHEVAASIAAGQAVKDTVQATAQPVTPTQTSDEDEKKLEEKD